MNLPNPEIIPFGKHSILVNWEPKIDEKALDFILLVKNSILKNRDKVIIEVINTYSSLLIKYNLSIKNIYNEILTIKNLISGLETQSKAQKKLFHLPVCYDKKFGLDLSEITTKNKLEIQEIKSLHSTPVYTIFFIGFLPGFLYFGGLDKKLFFPRKKSPRKEVEKGAVGIAGNQTGIYPQKSPGGWQIIGNCPVGLFDVQKNPPSIFKPGYKIKFYPISLEEHRDISKQVETGNFKIKTEAYED